MYTREEKERALKEFERLGSVQAVITLLGYPSRHTLYEWYRNKIANTSDYHGSLNKPYQVKEKYLNRPIVDCFDGMIVKWKAGIFLDAVLVNEMLDDAIDTLSPSEHPLVHTDRGCHYRWSGWIERMDAAGLTRSMSKKGCSPDNAACEGFFGRMKNEMCYGRSWLDVSIDDFITKISHYINWYNTKRIKQSLGYMSPVEYRHSLGLAI